MELVRQGQGQLCEHCPLPRIQGELPPPPASNDDVPAWDTPPACIITGICSVYLFRGNTKKTLIICGGGQWWWQRTQVEEGAAGGGGGG
jgi:hypothetical protein